MVLLESKTMQTIFLLFTSGEKRTLKKGRGRKSTYRQAMKRERGERGQGKKDHKR